MATLPHPEGSETVGEISMSGSQIGGILQVLEQLSVGLLDKNAAAALIASAFPTIPEKHVQSLVNGTQEKEVQPVPPQLGGSEVPPAEGEQVEVEEEQPQEQLELPLEDEEEPEDEEDEDLSGPEERAGSVGPDCGTGGGGFKAGNSCAKGGQSTGSSEKSKKSKGGGSEGGSSGGGGAAVAESGKKKDEGSLSGLGTKPIDKHLDVQGTAEDRKVAMKVIEAANKIHGVPSDYNTKLKIERPVDSIDGGDALGRFMPSKDSEGRVPVGGGKKDVSTIKYRNDLNHSKHMVLAHEVGHHVDYEVLGKDGVPFSRYNKKFNDPDGKIAAAKKELSNAFKESESYKFNRLALSNDPSAGKKLVEMGYPEGEKFKAFMDGNISRKTQTRMNTYLQQPTELFARAYAQKVGKHSGEAGIEMWSSQHRDKKIGTLQYRDKKKMVPYRFVNGATKMQWSDSDFKKIDRSMDKLFREVGLLNSSAMGTGGEDE